MTTPRWSTWWLKLDARNRAARTLVQGLVAAAVASAIDAGVNAVQRFLAGAAVTGAFDWNNLRDTTPRALGIGALTGAVAYVHRRWVDRSKVPSMLPPTPPGVPATTAVAAVTVPPVPLAAAGELQPWQRRDPVKVRRWTWIFLGATAFLVVPIGLELWAVADDSPNTVPWTEYISRGIPAPILIGIYLGLVAGMVWLWRHFVQWVKIWRARDPH